MKKSTSTTSISEIDRSGTWVNLRAKVSELREAQSESVFQEGSIEDGSGRIDFVSWKKSAVQPLEEGGRYAIENAAVEDWNGTLRLNLNDRTEVVGLDSDDGTDSIPLRRIEEVIPKSGAIERCPECRRVFMNDHCPVHVHAAPEKDLRVKTRTASGKTVIFGSEQSEELLDTTIEEAHNLPGEELEARMNDRFRDVEMRISLYPIAEEKQIFGVEKIRKKE